MTGRNVKMRKIRSNTASLSRRIFAALVAASSLPLVALAAPTYYVSPTGNDNADGLTPATAWSSLAKVDSTTYAPGTSILFQAGGTWRGQLIASSSGTASDPITYSSYGVGDKPTFYGSDILNKSSFAPVSGTASTYAISSPKSVGSVLGNGTFLDSAYLKNSRSTDLTTNLNYVNSHPNSYYYDNVGKQLYLNTGGNVAADSRQLTAVVQDDLVFSNYKNNLVFNDLVTRESAIDNAGYGFRIMGSTNVTVTNSEAYTAGKHNFGVINSTGFVGDNLKAANAMPDQGPGGATAFVSYADANYSNQTSKYSNITVSNMGGDYPAFYAHGEGLGQLQFDHWDVNGVGMSVSNGTATDIKVTNGELDVDGATVNRAFLSGTNARLTVYNNTTVSNLVIDGFSRTSGYAAPIAVSGENNKLEFSTITTGNGQVDHLLEFRPSSVTPSIQLIADIIQGFRPTSFVWSAQGFPPGQLDGDYNVYNNALFGPFNDILTLSQWQALIGDDFNSVLGAALFADIANGNFTLANGSPGSDSVPAALIDALSQYDYYGRPRVGPFVDAGAFGGAIPEPTFAFAPLVLMAFARRPGRNSRLLAGRRS